MKVQLVFFVIIFLSACSLEKEDPLSGEVYDVPEYEESGGFTRFQIELEDQGSRIFVFRDKPVGCVLPNFWGRSR
jgi:hypothetical protein